MIANLINLIHFDPLIPLWEFFALCTLSVLVLLLSRFKRSKNNFWRFCSCAVLLFWLANPIAIQEDKHFLPSTILMIVDHSDSMKIGSRSVIAQKTADYLEHHLPSTITAKVIPSYNTDNKGTRLFSTLDHGLEQISIPSLAGVIMITDGQVEDVPNKLPIQLWDQNHHPLPIHVLLTASKEQVDRCLHIVEAPPYAMVGQNTKIRVRIDDLNPPKPNQTAQLTLSLEDKPNISYPVPVGKEQDLTVPITHTGENFISLSISPLKGEITQRNNHKIVTVNGIRGKLRVLLISGTPNQDERAWRRLLKSDPSVELVHFTILRSEEQMDRTPLSDLALIPFPVQELFQEKIGLFDLIILDEFENLFILPPAYLNNIARYVTKGGGLLLIAGPEFAGPYSLQNSDLQTILPAHVPTMGSIIEEKFQPQLTNIGQQHPITANLSQLSSNTSMHAWGPWYRFLKADRVNGTVLMQTPDKSPLLILKHSGQGRVALLLSDQIWLWSREEFGGGPQAELLRRLSHWLMKEPELEEQRLFTNINNHQLHIHWQDMIHNSLPIFTVTAPNGKVQNIHLSSTKKGDYSASVPIDQEGIWKVSDGIHTTYAIPPSEDSLEFKELAVTARQFQPLVQNRQATIHWLGDHEQQLNVPTIRIIRDKKLFSGKDWIGFPQRNNYIVTNQKTYSILPGWIILLLGIGTLLFAWYRERTS